MNLPHPLPIEAPPWTVEIERDGRHVRRARVIAAKPRIVYESRFRIEYDRAGREIPGRGAELPRLTHTSPAVVCDCGVPYAGLAQETIIAHADLIAAAPELYLDLQQAASLLIEINTFLKNAENSPIFIDPAVLQKYLKDLARARGEQTP